MNPPSQYRAFSTACLLLGLLTSLLIQWPLAASVPIPLGVVQRRALLVAAEPGAERALRSLAEGLSARFAFRDRDIVQLYGAQATLKEIQTNLSRLREGGKAARSVLIIILLPRQDAVRDDYLVPFGGDPSQPWTLIPTSALLDTVSALPAAEKLLLLPSCSGGSDAMPSSVESRSSLGGVGVITLCSRSAENQSLAELAAILNRTIDRSSSEGRLGARELSRMLREAAPAYDVRYTDPGPNAPEFVFVDLEASMRRLLVALDSAEEAAKLAAIRALDDFVFTTSSDEREAVVARVAKALLRKATMPSEAVAVRVEAVTALGNIRYAAGVLELGSLLDSQETPSEVRLSVIVALTTIGGEGAATRIRANLADNDTAVRLLAARAEAQLKDREAIPHLVRLLGDSDVEVREAAVQALSALPNVKDEAERIRPSLEPLVADIAPFVRREAISLMGSLGQAPVPTQLISVLQNDPDPSVRAGAAYAIGRMAQEGGDLGTSRTALLRCLAPGEPQAVREASAWSLRRVGGRDAVRKLADVLLEQKSDQRSLRRTAAESLGMLGPSATAALPALIRALGLVHEPDVRAAAATAIGQVGGPIGDSRAVDGLRTALKDPDPYVRDAASNALSEVKFLPATVPGLQELAKALRDPSVSVRVDAARRLGDTHDPKAVSHLTGALGDVSQEVRWEASKALIGFTEDAVTPTLLSALADKSPYVRQGAVITLRVRNAYGHLPAIAARFRDDEVPIVRAEVVSTLSALSPTAYSRTIFQAASDRDPVVRAASIEGLRQIEGKEARAALESLTADHDPSVRHGAIEALQGFSIPKSREIKR